MNPCVAGAVALAMTAACNGGGTPATSPTPSPTTAAPSPSPASPSAASVAPSPSPSRPLAPIGCPGSYAAPDPNRPRVRIELDEQPGPGAWRGSESIEFRPDLAVDRLVFRLWPNEPYSRGGGARLTVLSSQVDRVDVPRRLSMNDTVLEVLPGPIAAGQSVTIDLSFSLQLPQGVNERLGHREGIEWFSSALPMLAWEPGVGWATEPPTSVFAEATTSAAFELRARVTVDQGQTVLATGSGAAPVTTAEGNHWDFSAPAVRDFAVAVGRFRLAKGSFDGKPVTVGVAPGLNDNPQQLLSLHLAAMRAHRARFGPFPYDDLDVPVVPDLRGGVENPGLIFLGAGQTDSTLSHEVGHEYFYGLVGNNQARDPWLDEAFATYAEALHRGTGGSYANRPPPAEGRNRVGRPMTYWESRASAYFRSVYLQGAVALLEARRVSGVAAFDAAIRCYVNANAHRIARPGDLAAALRHLPRAIAVLRRFGALP